MSERKSEVQRTTGETSIEVRLNVDGDALSEINTGVGFLDHMLNLFSRHSRFDLVVSAQGDLQVDDHHLVEDVGIVLGQALAQALGSKAGIMRYGWSMLPMDEVLVACSVDLSGRPVYVSNYQPARDNVGDLSTEMVDHFFRSLASEARMSLHFRFLDPGTNEHHRIEALFKAFARSLRSAVALDEAARGEIPSTKGVL